MGISQSAESGGWKHGGPAGMADHVAHKRRDGEEKIRRGGGDCRRYRVSPPCAGVDVGKLGLSGTPRTGNHRADQGPGAPDAAHYGRMTIGE